MIETIIFDLCEVYLQGMIGAEHEIGRTLQVPVNGVMRQISNKDMRLLFRGRITEDEYWQRIIQANGYPTSVAGHESTVTFLKEAMRRNFTELPGTRPLVQSLRGAGYQIGLLSDHAQEWVTYCEAHFPLETLFPVRCYSFQTGRIKRDSGSFQAVLAQLGADPRTTLFVDDKQYNLDAAQSEEVGIQHTHRFTTAAAFREALPQFGIDIN